MVGKKGSGKSVLMNMVAWLLSNHADVALAFTPSTDSKDMFETFIPECMIFKHYNSDRICKLIEHQRECTQGACQPGCALP